ncbi:hypothetical protein ACNPQM_36905 [Streptomyces sp. NPDC056231]|uniref:hypothetical protein n=1 Tax=Streptomyces sp. NPDC056231 TaxID=3345755 RepID=UPI003AAB9068
MPSWKASTRRSCITWALSGAVVLALSGCSPEERLLVAVYVDEHGTAQALLRSCDDDGQVRGPWLRGTFTTKSEEPTAGAVEGFGAAAPETEEPWIGWRARGINTAADFPLFAPPAQWRADTRGQQNLQPGYTYELTFGDPDDAYVYNGAMTFDATQLARVKSGEVLTRRGIMSMDAFEEGARKAC